MSGTTSSAWTQEPHLPDGTAIRLLVPSDKAGSVIGRGGSIIKQLREETGARIRICDQTTGCQERAILISPAVSLPDVEGMKQVEQAAVAVHKQVASAQAEPDLHESTATRVHQRILVDQSQTGCLIGRRGEAARRFRDDTGCELKVQSREDVPRTYGVSAMDRVVQITGPRDYLPRGILTTARRLRESPPKRQFTPAEPAGYPMPMMPPMPPMMDPNVLAMSQEAQPMPQPVPTPVAFPQQRPVYPLQWQAPAPPSPPSPYHIQQMPTMTGGGPVLRHSGRESAGRPFHEREWQQIEPEEFHELS